MATCTTVSAALTGWETLDSLVSFPSYVSNMLIDNERGVRERLHILSAGDFLLVELGQLEARL